MFGQKIQVGRLGEEAAAAFLRTRGYRILHKNYKTKFGEIDIIARDKDTFCFVEVKTRHSQTYGLPQEAVIESKQRRISRVAVYFLKTRNLLDTRVRFDVVSVRFENARPQCELIRNAFELQYED